MSHIADELVLPFESPWSAFSKMGWLQGLTPGALLRRQFPGRLNLPKSYLEDPCFANLHDPLLWMWGLADRDRQGTGAEPSSLWHRRIYSDFQLIPESLGALESWIRWCPICLHGGYHSVLHQSSVLVRCVFDGAQLHEGCPRCGRQSIAWCWPVGWDGSFACASCCREPALDTCVLPSAELSDRVRTMSHLLVDWLGCVRKTKCYPVPQRAHFEQERTELLRSFDLCWLWAARGVRESPIAVDRAGPAPECFQHVLVGRDEAFRLFVDVCAGSEAGTTARRTLADLLDDVAREFVASVADRHPCLLEAPLATIDASSRECEVDRTACLVSAGFAKWFTWASKLAEPYPDDAGELVVRKLEAGRDQDLRMLLLTGLCGEVASEHRIRAQRHLPAYKRDRETFPWHRAQWGHWMRPQDVYDRAGAHAYQIRDQRVEIRDVPCARFDRA